MKHRLAPGRRLPCRGAGGRDAAARIEGRSPPPIHADSGVSSGIRCCWSSASAAAAAHARGAGPVTAIDRALAECACRRAGPQRPGGAAAYRLRHRLGRYRLAPGFRDAGRLAASSSAWAHRPDHRLAGAGVIDLGVTYRGVAATPIESVGRRGSAMDDQPPAIRPAAKVSQMPCTSGDEI